MNTHFDHLNAWRICQINQFGHISNTQNKQQVTTTQLVKLIDINQLVPCRLFMCNCAFDKKKTKNNTST